MSDNSFKCGSCGTIQESKFFSSQDYNQRYVCGICGPLCKDCTTRNVWLTNKCNSCGKEVKKTENFINGRWK